MDSSTIGSRPFQIFAVDDDINAVCKSADRPSRNNNSIDIPTLNSHPLPAPHRVVGSPSRTPKSSARRMGASPARSFVGTSLPIGTPKRVVRIPPTSSTKKLPVRQPSSTPTRLDPVLSSRSVTPQFGRLTTPTARPSAAALLFSQKRINNNESLFSLDNLSLSDSYTAPADPLLSQFEQSLLSREDYLSKTGQLNDAFKERQECPLIYQIIDSEVSIDDTYALLHSADPKMALAFMKSNRGSRYIRDLMSANENFRLKIALLIIHNKMVNELSFSPLGNFVVQSVFGSDANTDTALVEQLIKQMRELAMDKYGCRVIQVVVETVHPDLVRHLVHALEGFELRICLDKNGTHVIQCLLENHKHHTYETFFRPFTAELQLRVLMEDKFGCRIAQKCLESLAKQITTNYVPQILNDLIVPLLNDASRYVKNEYGNYVIQFIISSPSFKRQRDYIIDHILLRNLLSLSQGKFSSHVVEASLNYACPTRLARMCNEIFHDYKVVEKGRTPLEILMFDQFGNYVVQKLLQIAVEVSVGRRAGDSSWMSILKVAVVRNEQRLQRYSSGKKILEILAKIPTLTYQQPAMYFYENNGYYHRY